MRRSAPQGLLQIVQPSIQHLISGGKILALDVKSEHTRKASAPAH
jgi:hypothetical protein